jgi:hypothetical protein
MNKQIHRTRAVVARGAEAEALLERHALKAGGADFCSLIMCFVHGNFQCVVAIKRTRQNVGGQLIPFAGLSMGAFNWQRNSTCEGNRIIGLQSERTLDGLRQYECVIIV